MDNKITIVPTLKNKITKNCAWCASFNLVWKDFVKTFLKNDFEYQNKDNETIKNLMSELNENLYIDKKDYYLKSGKQTIKLKKKILKGLKKKFNQSSDILNNINFDNDKNTDKILIYAMLYFSTKFEYEFINFKNKLEFGENKIKVDSFGFNSNDKNTIKEQASPLFYNNENDFAVKLETKTNKQIILYRTDKIDTFENIYDNIIKQSNECKDNIKILKLQIPNLDFNIQQNFKDLTNTNFLCKSTKLQYTISEAQQTLKMKLNNEGATVKSEAYMSMRTTCCRPQLQKIKDFIFNNTFYLFIINNENPIVSLRIEDIENFI